jgi:hypothetical protein
MMVSMYIILALVNVSIRCYDDSMIDIQSWISRLEKTRHDECKTYPDTSDQYPDEDARILINDECYT